MCRLCANGHVPTCGTVSLDVFPGDCDGAGQVATGSPEGVRGHRSSADQVVAAAILGAIGSLLTFTGMVTALGYFVRRSETIEALVWASFFAVATPLGVFIAARLIGTESSRRSLTNSVAPTIALTGLVLVVTRSLAPNMPSGGTFLLIVIPVAGAIYFMRSRLAVWLEIGVLRPWHQGLLVALGLVCIIVSFLPSGTVSIRQAIAAAAATAVIAECAMTLDAIRTRVRLGRRTRFALTLVLALSLGLWVWDVSFRPNPYDQNFFLGPVIDIHHGRFVLVEVYSQYGVAVINFIGVALNFLGLGYGSLLLLVGFCTALGAITMFSVLRIATRSLAWATAGAFCAAVAGPFATMERSFQFPSTGFLRFGPTWLMVLALVLAYRFDRLRWRPMAVACLLLGVSSIWSFEAAFYSTGTFTVTVLAVAWSNRRLRDAWPPLAAGAVAIFASMFLFVAMTALGRGELANPGGYLDFIRLYSSSGFGTLPVGDWSLGYLIIALYVASFVGVAVAILLAPRSRFSLPSTIVPIVATTAFGVLSFTYFLGRSHPNNLTHIAPPFVIMITLWTALGAHMWRTERRVIYGAAVVVVIWAGALLTVCHWDLLEEKSGDSALSAVLSPLTTSPSFLDQIRVLRSNPPVSTGAQFVDRLVRESVPEDAPILVLVDPPVLTESLLRLDRANVIPLTTPGQDGLLPSRRRELIAAASSIPCGTWIVTQNAPFGFGTADESSLLNGILSNIKEGFALERLATTDGGRYQLSRAQCRQ